MDFCIHSIFNTVCSAMHTFKLSKLVVLKVVITNLGFYELLMRSTAQQWRAVRACKSCVA